MNPVMILTLLEAAVRALLLAVLVWGGLRVLRVRNVRAQKIAWSLVLVAALAMPLLTHWQWLPVPAVRLQGLTPVQSSAAASEALPEATIAPAGAARTVKRATRTRAAETEQTAVAAAGDRYPAPEISQAEFGVAQAPAAEAAPAHTTLWQRVKPLVPQPVALAWMAYLGICAVLVARLAVGLVFAARLWGTARPVAAAPQFALPAELRLRASKHVASPVAVGSGIVLPHDYAEWDPEKLRVVLAHERSHVQQGDFYLQLLARLYAALFWLSPLGWWLKRKLTDLGEAISDHAGLEAAASRTSYAQVLLEFAVMPRPNMIGVPMAHSSNLSERIERFLNESAFHSAFAPSRRRTLAAALLVPVGLFAATALVRVEAATVTAPQAPAVTTPQAAQPAALPAVLPGEPAPAAPAALAEPSVSVSVPVLKAILPAGAFSAIERLANAPQVAPAPVAPVSAMLPPAAPQVPLPVMEAAVVTPARPGKLRAMLAMISDDGRPEATFDRTLSAGAHVTLEAVTGAGNIHIVHGSDNSVHIHGVVRADREGTAEQVQAIAANPPIEQSGDAIRIGGHGNDERLRHISISYEIEAPAGAALTATTGSGDITDDGVGQQAKLQTGSGNIHATGLRAGFTAQTGSGNVYVEEAGEGEVKAQTGSGNIELKGTAGGLKAQTGSGDIKITGTPTADWKLETGSGNIELWTGNAPLTLDASFGSGGVRTDREMLTQGTFDKHHIVGKLGGGGPTVRMETGSGDIRVH